MHGRVWGKRPGLFKNNSRFYLLLFSFVTSIGMLGLVRLMVEPELLFRIRLQQVYGFVAIGFWYFALLATPLSTIFGKQGVMAQYLYIRRALGVSAAYFAVLHMLVSLFGQLGGVTGVMQLQGRFRLALVFGFIGVCVLLVMAVTSFDRVIRKLTFPRWKWIHRIGYAAGVLVYAHLWMIGTHLEDPLVRGVLFGFLSLLAVVESWRVSVLIERVSGEKNKSIKILLFASFCLVLVGALAATPRLIKSYHSEHSSPTEKGGRH